MAQDIRLKRGSVIQATEKAKDWAGCTLIVDEVKTFGVQAYLRVPYKGDAFMRLKWDEFEYIGEAKLIRRED